MLHIALYMCTDHCAATSESGATAALGALLGILLLIVVGLLVVIGILAVKGRRNNQKYSQSGRSITQGIMTKHQLFCTVNPLCTYIYCIIEKYFSYLIV